MDTTPVLKEQENPSYLTFDNQQQFLYSVHGDYTDVTSYAIDETTGTLTFINKISLEGGKNPVFITVDKSNRFLLVATLQGGKIFVIRREENGALGEVVFTWRFAGKTDDAISHAHQCIWDQDKNYLFVPQQGRVVGYAGVSVLKFDPESGRLIETDYFRAGNMQNHAIWRSIRIINIVIWLMKKITPSPGFSSISTTARYSHNR